MSKPPGTGGVTVIHSPKPAHKALSQYFRQCHGKNKIAALKDSRMTRNVE